MKFSVNWLREFVESPPSIDALAELLTMSGVEIEAIEKRGADFDCVVVAQIIESKPHPNADRLTVCVVDDGSGTKRQIVCGAKNYKVDDKVPLALPGAELTGGLKIRASKLRGVESEGICIRSINNVVDVSNVVMLELGQPTHAFDADKLSGEISVRLAREGEKFLALDGKTYALTPENLVIADDERAVGIAGVMGGEESGVTESTRNVLLESAYFLPASIRRTARELNLPSDASYRFERGVDPEMISPASTRSTELICEVAGATSAPTVAVAGELPPDPPDVSLRYEGLDQLLGIHIEPATADGILTRFGLTKSDSASHPRWKIPS